MKSKFERAAVPVLAFLIPGLVMLWVYASLGMAPWGDKTVLITDMSGQYVDFFCALKNGDLFFSWSKALGTSYIGVFSFYMSSLLSTLTLLVPNEAMPVGVMFLTVLKVSLAGLSFSIFAKKRFPDCGYAALLGSVCYALMSYNAIYSIDIMWLDGVIWLPLILLALERILAGRGAGPFVAALVVCFLSNWYTSYMVGGFCALYLCARLAALRPERAALKKILLRFFGGAACALGLTAWMWLPTFLAMFIGKFSGGNVDYDGLLACTPLKLLSQLRTGQYGGVGYEAPPYVYCGVVTLAGGIVYFFLKRIPRRERIINGVVLLLLTASILLSPLDKVWHLFQRPNWFPFRWSFIFSFFLVYLAVQAAPRPEKWRPWMRRGLAAALALLTVWDLGFNTKSIIGGLERQLGCDSYQAYRTNYINNAQLTAAAKADAGENFFRMGSMKEEDRSLNSPLAFGYPGITHYSSAYNYDVNHLTRALGFAQTWYWCAYYGSTPVTDALFDMQYVISGSDMPPGYEPIAQAGELTLWKNPDVLPIAFLTDGGIQGLAGENPFQRQNSLVSGLLGEEIELFTPAYADAEAGQEETVYTVRGTGKPVYIDLTRVLTSEESHIYYLGTPNSEEAWTITVPASSDAVGNLWELDQDALHDAVEKLDQVNITSVEKNGRVRLTVQADGGQTLCTTIPAENGWTAYVDGEKVELEDWLETFLCLNLPAGIHEVELRYTAPGLVPGIALGVLALAGLVLVNARGGWKKEADPEEETVPEEETGRKKGTGQKKKTGRKKKANRRAAR